MARISRRKPATPTYPEKQHLLFAVWSDSPPEVIGLLNGTDAEARAWCAGWTAAMRCRRDIPEGDAATLDEIQADPASYGITGEVADLLKGGA